MKQITFFALLLTSLTAFSQDSERGKGLYATCIQCHGEKGEGNVKEEAPRISGQYDWYIVSQLEAFQSGARKNPKMLPFIKALSKKDFSDLAAYISKL